MQVEIPLIGNWSVHLLVDPSIRKFFFRGATSVLRAGSVLGHNVPLLVNRDGAGGGDNCADDCDYAEESRGEENETAYLGEETILPERFVVFPRIWKLNELIVSFVYGVDKELRC